MSSPTTARADGGIVRQSICQGKFQVTVFTSPTPPRVGSIEVSVLVQDATTGELRPKSQVWIRATPRGQPDRTIGRPANGDAATNKLLNVAVLDLPVAGWWEVLVSVEEGDAATDIGFDLEVSEPLPEWFSLVGWIAWPFVVIALYSIHRLLVRRKEYQGR